MWSYSVNIVLPAVCSCIDSPLHSLCMLTFPLTLSHGCLLCCMHQPPTLTQPPSHHLLGSSHPWYVHLFFPFWRWTVVMIIVFGTGVALWHLDAWHSIWIRDQDSDVKWAFLTHFCRLLKHVLHLFRDSPEETGGRAWKNDRAGGSLICALSEAVM